MNVEILDKITESAYSKARALKPDDISVISAYSEESMLRFSNNSVTVIDTLKEAAVFIYMAKEEKKVIGATSTVNESDLDNFVDRLFSSIKFTEKSVDYVPLPKIRSNPSPRNYDSRIEKLGEKIADYGGEAINAALKEGAKRVSGVLTANTEAYKIKTSGGVENSDKVTSMSINVRAFSSTNSSGHGLSCAASLPNFNGVEAGSTAGRFAKESQKTGHWEEGEYELIMGPTVTADLLEMVGYSSSAFRVDAGTSFLKDYLGKKIATDDLTLEDYGAIEGGLAGRSFDDEGVPTQKTCIIDKGMLQTYLHNSSTAKKYGTKTTGNAGIIAPHPWNLVVASGKSDLDETIRETKKGVYVTNNWYTRYQNYLAGEYSTLPRDATFLIENGSIKYAINGTRISDNIPRQLLNIKAIGKERKWIEWWEVETPILTPTLVIDNVAITKAQL
jgi:PmbA protein